jgi:hypothetical protein
LTIKYKPTLHISLDFRFSGIQWFLAIRSNFLALQIPTRQLTVKKGLNKMSGMDCLVHFLH